MPPIEGPRAKFASSPDLTEAAPAQIVVADDDRIARELLAGTLRNAGHTVHAVADGQEAVDRVAQGGIDLVLLDIVMPRLSGLEACRLLKGITADSFLPVILVTVRTDSASRVEGLRIGADDYVTKPFEEQELLARVASMLRIKRLHDHVVTQRAKFERMSIHDELTGLYNYRYLHTRLGEEFKRAERYHEPFACMVIDIDHLRVLNEAHGRPAGDAAIRAVAESIKRCVRDVDVVARYGGEEFLVVLPSTHFAGSMTVAERIWREVESRARAPRDSAPPDTKRSEVLADPAGGPAPAFTLSLGVALYPSRDVRSKDALLRAADVALAQAKREGGNRICVFQQQGYIYTPAVGSRFGLDLQVPSSARLPEASVSGTARLPDGSTRGRLPDSWRPGGSDTGRVSSTPDPVTLAPPRPSERLVQPDAPLPRGLDGGAEGAGRKTP